MGNFHFFTVVENSDKETFCKEVSSLLEDGWDLKGDPAFIGGLDSSGKPCVGIYAQALHKTHKNPEDRRFVQFGT